MRYLARALKAPLIKAAKSFAAVVLTGPRRVGKTWLLRHTFSKAEYFLLEDPSVVVRLCAAILYAIVDQFLPPASKACEFTV